MKSSNLQYIINQIASKSSWEPIRIEKTKYKTKISKTEYIKNAIDDFSNTINGNFDDVKFDEIHCDKLQSGKISEIDEFLMILAIITYIGTNTSFEDEDQLIDDIKSKQIIDLNFFEKYSDNEEHVYALFEELYLGKMYTKKNNIICDFATWTGSAEMGVVLYYDIQNKIILLLFEINTDEPEDLVTDHDESVLNKETIDRYNQFREHMRNT